MTNLTLNPLTPGNLGVNAPVQGDLFGFNGTGWEPLGPTYNVSLFSVATDTDDTNAFQRAFDAAAVTGGTVEFEPGVTYVLSSTVTIQPSSGSNVQVHVRGGGKYTQIKWNGGSNTSVFKSYGWAQSSIEGVRVRLYGNTTGVVVWDIDHDTNRNSTGRLSFRDCHVTSDAVGTKTSCMGWRVGHSTGTSVEFSYIEWDTCAVNFASGDTSCTGFGLEENNGLICNWFNTTTSYCNEGWTCNQSSGAGGTAGSSSWTLIGCGGSSNTTDFVFKGAQYTIIGGRWELGSVFISSPFTTASRSMTVTGVEIAGYSQNGVFDIQAGTLILNNIKMIRPSASAHGATTIQLNNASVQTACHVHGGQFHASDPFITASNGTLNRVVVEDAQIINSSGVVTGQFINTARVQASTGSAEFSLDGSGGKLLTIANNATANPFSNANNFSGLFLVVDTNSSGGAALFLTSGAIMTKVAETTASIYTTTSGSASRVNVYLNGSFAVEIENKRGSSIDFRVLAIRIRTSQ